jgi:hypothetical protein
MASADVIFVLIVGLDRNSCVGEGTCARESEYCTRGIGRRRVYTRDREEDGEHSQEGHAQELEQEELVREIRRFVQEIRLQEPVQTQIGLHCQRRLRAVRQNLPKSAQQPLLAAG